MRIEIISAAGFFGLCLIAIGPALADGGGGGGGGGKFGQADLSRRLRL